MIKMFEQKIQEGVYDRGIFKAFFLAGGPGSGKSFVTQKVTSGLSLKVINSDLAFERGIVKAGLGLNIVHMSDEEYNQAMNIRQRAKDLTSLKQELAIKGRLGLVIDGTGRDFKKITGQATALNKIGYDVYMIFVNTSLQVALERNLLRDRIVPENLVTQYWKNVQSNMGGYQNFFGAPNFIVVDNNNATEDILLKVWKKISKYVDAPVENYIAKQWIEGELQTKRSY